jgi:hypothetical protein
MMKGIGEVAKRAARSDRQRDLPGPLEPADRLASPPIRHASVDEARLDVSMTKVILYEVDRLACVECSCLASPGAICTSW